MFKYKNRMKVSIFRLPFLLLSILAISVACEDNSYNSINYEEMEAEELAILGEFYDNSDAWDSLLTISTDTIDKRSSSGLMYLERVKGTGDSVLVGKQVGVRFSSYVLDRDSLGKPALFLYESNTNSPAPHTFVVGSGDAYYTGLEEGVSYMKNFGKSTLILPSTISTGRSYLTMVVDVEVVFVELD
ncbi:hypothetical protein ACT3CD_05805 [Geofilum sp. OHC36d9]|uniref:hypothetical protein n=1 Tax=Geofilum sp. OHC36d9 TaxID=3458413 RepID=UPI004034ED89